MRSSLILAAAIAALSVSPALAAKKHLPFPLPVPAPSPAPSPKPAPAKGGLQDILGLQTELVTILNEVVADQAGQLNPTTGQSWDPSLVMCLNGNPGSGTAGQPGYVAPMPGLISWIQTLPTPSLAAVPPVVNANGAEEAEHARLLVIAGLQDAANVTNIIQSGGSSLQQGVIEPCAAFANSALIVIPGEVAGQIAAVVAIVKPWIPAAMALKEKKAKP